MSQGMSRDKLEPPSRAYLPAAGDNPQLLRKSFDENQLLTPPILQEMHRLTLKSSFSVAAVVGLESEFDNLRSIEPEDADITTTEEADDAETTTFVAETATTRKPSRNRINPNAFKSLIG
jgi:hypothetical protein